MDFSGINTKAFNSDELGVRILHTMAIALTNVSIENIVGDTNE